MFCPVCKDVDLALADRQGIEIDYCPRCRGVWLDRGELDKLIERSVQLERGEFSASAHRQAMPDLQDRRADFQASGHGHDNRDKYSKYGQNRPRGSFLRDLFD